MRLIDADALKKRMLEASYDADKIYPELSKKMRRVTNAFMRDIDEEPTALRWISVTDRLPDNYDDVLITDGCDTAVAGWRKEAHDWDSSIAGWIVSNGAIGTITHWMPLPEPPGEN